MVPVPARPRGPGSHAVSAPVESGQREALRLHVTGLVQGIGFRPFVHRLAVRHGLAGWVRNSAGDVEIEVEGAPAELQTFVERLATEAPPLARIGEIERTPVAPRGATSFEIRQSATEPDRRQPVSPDVALCAACERELFDPENRRYRYPFITCTDCGPRFTVIEAMPYDRERTSMRAFTQCRACLQEYRAPGDRRYHSQSNSCPACGPRAWLEETARKGQTKPPGESLGSQRAIERAAELLRAGKIVALRGLGGFHLAADATNEQAVARLRARKGREAKPLAVMVRTLDDARRLGSVGSVEAELLCSAARPIVLLKRSPDCPLAPSVAPGLDTVGVMTAYTPLHHLLLEAARCPLVMTSGNRTDEPIAIANDEAMARLAGIADTFLLHDREIVSRYDDSVLRVAAGAPLFLRRARGYAPLPLPLPVPTPLPLVAVGPHLKNTFTLAHEQTAYVSQHIGDLEDLDALEHFERTLELYRRLFKIEPQVAVRDRHPGYLSSEVAEELGLERVIQVQHHHAHVAAVAGEYGVTQRVVGIAYDGAGYGDDGTVWGAEVLVADVTGCERVGQLRYAPLPGGDLAVRQPWRTALGYLSLEPGAAGAFQRAFEGVPDAERRLAANQIRSGLNAPQASSMGRLFDAAAAILGVRLVSHYEGQAAMELEALAGNRQASALPFPILEAGQGRWVLDPLPLVSALGDRRAAGHEVADLAAEFHESVAAATSELAARAAAAYGIDVVALGGGVFQNARLLESLVRRLQGRRLRVLVPRGLSPNDGAISYGQAAIAAARLAREVA